MGHSRRKLGRIFAVGEGRAARSTGGREAGPGRLVRAQQSTRESHSAADQPRTHAGWALGAPCYRAAAATEIGGRASPTWGMLSPLSAGGSLVPAVPGQRRRSAAPSAGPTAGAAEAAEKALLKRGVGGIEAD